MCYVHTPVVFSQKQIDSLRKDLKLTNHQQVQDLLRSLDGAVGYFRFRKQQREATPDVRSARTDATSIFHHAKALREAIDKSPIDLFYLDFDNTDREAETKTELARVLNGIMKQASIILRDEEFMRRLYGLPEINSANQNIKTQHLWPTLFDIYEETTGNINYSSGGPLERYIGVVHEVCELEQPSTATLRTAVHQWRMDKAQH